MIVSSCLLNFNDYIVLSHSFFYIETKTKNVENYCILKATKHDLQKEMRSDWLILSFSHHVILIYKHSQDNLNSIIIEIVCSSVNFRNNTFNKRVGI